MADRISLRLNRPETARLTVALLVSLAVHFGAWGSYEVGKKQGWWKHFQSSVWAQKVRKNFSAPAAQLQPVDPTIFVEVTHADQEPTAPTKFYSNKNSQAANPDPGDANQPKLNGKQKDVPKTEDAPRVNKLQPSPAPTPTPPATAENVLPGDNKNAKTNLLAVAPKPAPPEPERPRTVNQARAQNSQALPGQQMQQAGGVKRQLQWSALDAKSTAFGSYDRAIIEAVTQRWYDLLDSRRFAMDRTGKVTLQFKLKVDGSVTEMHTVENTVGELLGYVCRSAIEEAAPFAKWPADMQRMIGANFREITFTFYYY